MRIKLQETVLTKFAKNSSKAVTESEIVITAVNQEMYDVHMCCDGHASDRSSGIASDFHLGA